MAAGFIVLSVLLLPTMMLGFEVDNGTPLNHQEITKRAFLNVTVQVCRANAQSKGRVFTPPVEPYTVETVLAACQALDGAKVFYQNMKLIQKHNIKIDKSVRYNSPSHHFHNEAFNNGRDIVAGGLGAVKASNKKGNYKLAKKQLGKISHSLQDFYSHSNWVEIGQDKPNSNLLKGNGNVGNIAAETRATCQNCSENNCSNNILNDILNEKVLTSGYFALQPSNTKPAGKCSHGGPLDGSSTVNPKGGINKDTPESSHGQLHEKAANIATAATSELLEDIRAAAGDSAFLQMIGANTEKALCFVIDTTGSMGDDIVAVKQLTSIIVNNGAGTQQMPSVYFLVTFNDPTPGPVLSTTDPSVFKAAIDSLSASGGGDLPEMSLSGLQLALTSAPPGSEIFLFTDAPAKDPSLKNNLIAVIEQSKSVVNFMITGVFESSDIQVYDELAQASGGLVILVPKSQLIQATDIIFDSFSSTMVTLLKEVSNTSANFTFAMDDTLSNVIVYITGSITSLTLISPSGETQTGTVLITSSTNVGSFRRMKLKKEVGLWELRVVSDSAYTVKIAGESSITFIYDFLEPAQGPLGGLVALESRPRASANCSLELTLIGSDTATVTEVYLAASSGQVKGTVTNQGKKDYFVQFDNIPSQKFTVLVKGQQGSRSFQRQATTSIKASSVSVTADELSGIIEPGASLSLPFTVSSDTGGTFNIQVNNDQGFTVNYPTSLELTGGFADGKVILTAPVSAESGTEFDLIIQAAALGSTDMNYAVMGFTVLKKVTDFTSPTCELLSSTSCSQTCSSSTWQVSIRVSDGTDGTGVDSVYLRQGNGTLTINMASGNGKMVFYTGSCCSSTIEMVVVDSVGNVGFCTYTTQDTKQTPTTTQSNIQNDFPALAAQSMSPRLVQSSFLCLIISLLGNHLAS